MSGSQTGQGLLSPLLHEECQRSVYLAVFLYLPPPPPSQGSPSHVPPESLELGNTSWQMLCNKSHQSLVTEHNHLFAHKFRPGFQEAGQLSCGVSPWGQSGVGQGWSHLKASPAWGSTSQETHSRGCQVGREGSPTTTDCPTGSEAPGRADGRISFIAGEGRLGNGVGVSHLTQMSAGTVG